MKKYNKILDKIKDALKPHLDNMENVYLVGSIVYGNFDECSDIDIIIYLNTPQKKKIRTELGSFDIKWTPHIGLYTIYKADKEQRKHPTTLKLSVINIQTGEIVYGNLQDENFYSDKKINRKRAVFDKHKNTLSEVWGTNLINLKDKE